jgi:hypothetical protein
MINFNSNLRNRSLYWIFFWLVYWWAPSFSGNLSRVLMVIVLTTPMRLSLPLLVQSKPKSNILPVYMSGIFSALFFGLIWGQVWQEVIQNCDEPVCKVFGFFWTIFVYFYAALGGFVGELLYRVSFAPKTSDR